MANTDYGFKVKEEEEREKKGMFDSHPQEEKVNSSKAFNKLSSPTTGQITRVSTTLGSIRFSSQYPWGRHCSDERMTGNGCFQEWVLDALSEPYCPSTNRMSYCVLSQTKQKRQMVPGDLGTSTSEFQMVHNWGRANISQIYTPHGKGEKGRLPKKVCSDIESSKNKIKTLSIS